VSFLSWTQVLGPRAVIVVTVATVIIGLAIRGRIKHFGSHKAVKITSRHAYWTKLMDASITYDEWAQAASMLVPEGDLNESMLYDEAFVQGKLSELQQRRMEGSVQEIIFSLRADLSRNLGNMCNPQLHIRRQQIPRLIHEYQNEVRHHLHAICEMNPEEFTLEEKLTCMMETRQTFGRTALVFSGHVAFGTFHTSVFRTLVEHQVLPSIVVGVNVGAIVSSFATTRTSAELQYFFDHPAPPMQFYEKMCAAYVAAYRLSTQDASTYEIEKLQQSMQDLIGDLTFEEAFELSGRVLGISIPACRLGNQPSQFLNYLTSPHVVIWSAVAVSCAPPVGLLTFPELMIKNQAGEIVHYLPPTKVRDSHHYM
jgi:TAG lipase/steryl ester hydrolase/phospholipase A2/LPA acyltransferase